MWFDPVEIGEVIYNLVENAAKYSRADSPIDLLVRTSGSEALVAVQDRGPGIPATAVPHLFDPFYRVMDRNPPARGLGLGLAIVKGLVEAHGGRVWVDNRPEGGARFTFTLPLGDVPADVVPTPAQAENLSR
jgi:two-component system sensor histidine kinase KdpD